MKHNAAYQAMVEVTRGPLVESVHFGAMAITDARGSLLAGWGDPNLVANLRSSSKPFQTLPLIEQGGCERFGLTNREIAITCASHWGTDDHVSVLRGLQARIGVQESDLLCGVHPAIHESTRAAMQERGEEPTCNRHNCSGKHTGMLAQSVLGGQPLGDYLSSGHEVQQTILRTFAEVTGTDPADVLVGIDGCSAPTFAIPLRSAAMGFARLADPYAAVDQLGEARAAALERIARAMRAHPDMVAGPGGFDTLLMQAGSGKIVCKGGAEGYQAVGLLPGAAGPGSPALGIALKISDGDHSGRARPVVIVEVLRQLGALDDAQVEMLHDFAARPVYNSRSLEVGVIRPAFALEIAAA